MFDFIHSYLLERKFTLQENNELSNNDSKTYIRYSKFSKNNNDNFYIEITVYDKNVIRISDNYTKKGKLRSWTNILGIRIDNLCQLKFLLNNSVGSILSYFRDDDFVVRD